MSENQQASNRIELQDKFYNVISKFANNEWMQFARSANGLGLLESEIDDIRHDHLHDIKEQKYQMLELWQQKNAGRATADFLDNLAENFFMENLEEHSQPIMNQICERPPLQVGQSNPQLLDDASSLSGEIKKSMTIQCDQRINLPPDESVILREAYYYNVPSTQFIEPSARSFQKDDTSSHGSFGLWCDIVDTCSTIIRCNFFPRFFVAIAVLAIIIYYLFMQ